MTFDTLITDSHVVLPQGIVDKNIIIEDGKIFLATETVPYGGDDSESV